MKVAVRFQFVDDSFHYQSPSFDLTEEQMDTFYDEVLGSDDAGPFLDSDVEGGGDENLNFITVLWFLTQAEVDIGLAISTLKTFLSKDVQKFKLWEKKNENV